MKSPPMTGSSGSSTESKKVASHLIRSGVQKSSALARKAGKASPSTGGQGSQNKIKSQAFFDTAREINADDKARVHLFEVRKVLRETKEATNRSSNDVGECPGYDVKGLMAHVYQDLHRVAAAQGPKIASGGIHTERTFLGELSQTVLLLREVSVGVTSVIKSALAHLYNNENPQSSEVWDIHEKMSRCLLNKDPASQRYGNLVSHHSWKFLSKLAHSAAFRHAACTLDASTWQVISSSIDENAVSLTVFTECCGLQWWTELIHLNSLFPPSFSKNFTKYQLLQPKKPSLHKWVVTEKHEDVYRPKFEGKSQINIHNNIYREKSFASSPRPPSWPADRPYPEDPTKVRSTSLKSCITCDSHTPCTCSFLSSPEIWHALVELREYGRKGVGVRALERIPRNAILGEYVGEILPADYNGDPIYALDFSLPGCANDEVIGTISSKRFGNWTRFMNHSCDASTRFRNVTMGGSHRMVVQAVRDIEVFEEVTVDYGDGYWRDRVCECGVEECFSRRKMGEVQGPGVVGS